MEYLNQTFKFIFINLILMSDADITFCDVDIMVRDVDITVHDVDTCITVRDVDT